jgi:acetyltransferase-like isoleucine patch superfamily enzyme
MNEAIPDFVETPGGIDSALLERALGRSFVVNGAFAGVGDVVSNHRAGLLTFVSDDVFIAAVNDNANIAGTFCFPVDVGKFRDGIQVLPVDDPRFHFFSLIDFLARNYHKAFPTRVGANCRISPQASIAPHSVVIGENVVIESGAFIAAGSVLADNVVIRANATIGVDGFQHQRTSYGTVSPLHDGWLFIEHDAEIGYSSSISRGFSYRPTRIGHGTKIDALAYVAHGSSLGPDTIVCAHAAIMGHATIGKEAWIGPGSIITSRVTIGDRAKVSLGSVVTTDVPADARYTGNFALPHDKFVIDLKKRASP